MRAKKIGIIILVLVGVITPSFVLMEIKNGFNADAASIGRTLYVGGSGLNNFTEIQDAVDASLQGDRIVVFPGFYGNVEINKSISLEGRNAFTSSVLISAANVTFSGFVVEDCYRAIVIEGNNNKVSNCAVLNSSYGIKIHGNGNKIYSNKIFKNLNYGVWIENGKGNNISGNGVYRNNFGIYAEDAGNNVIENNVVTGNTEGIKIQGGKNNTIRSNHITENSNDGIYLCCDSEENIIFENNFIDNNMSAKCYSRNNRWDYHQKGNYWDDYDGAGAYDIPYGGNADNYPSPNPYNISICPVRIYIISPADGSGVSGTVKVKGIAEDGKTVEIKVDNGSWKKVDGTFLWNFDINTEKIANGEHHIYARCGNSSAEITLHVSNEGKTPSFGTVMFLGAFVFVVTLVRRIKAQETSKKGKHKNRGQCLSTE